MPVIAKRQSVQHLNVNVNRAPDRALSGYFSTVDTQNRKIRKDSGFFYFRVLQLTETPIPRYNLSML